jgi:hypothetical protein
VRLSTTDKISQQPGKNCSGKVQARAFEPYFTTKAVGVGTGLGGLVRITGWPGREVRVGTLVSHAATIGIPATTWLAAGILVPFAFLGGLAGRPIGDRLGAKAFTVLAIALLAVARAPRPLPLPPP